MLLGYKDKGIRKSKFAAKTQLLSFFFRNDIIKKKLYFIFLSGKKVLIIGAGPCGLRLALETQLLGKQGPRLGGRAEHAQTFLKPFVNSQLNPFNKQLFWQPFCLQLRTESIFLSFFKFPFVNGIFLSFFKFRLLTNLTLITVPAFQAKIALQF